MITQWRHDLFKKNKSVMLHAFLKKQRYRFTVFDKNTKVSCNKQKYRIMVICKKALEQQNKRKQNKPFCDILTIKLVLVFLNDKNLLLKETVLT